MQLGRPIIEKTPSGLRRVTRFYKLDPDAAKAANVETSAFVAYGTADVEFTTAVLVEQRIDRRSEQGAAPTLIQVFQELADNELTATTEVSESTLFDGRRITRTLYLCKASQAAALRPAIGGGVFQVEVAKNGPVATVTKFEITLTNSGFIYSQADDERNNGKLLIRTLRTLGTVAATPSGYTLVSQNTTTQDGYTVYNATFAKGLGRISSDVAYKQNGKLKITTIRYLNTDDGAAVSGTLVNDDAQQQDGYTLYTKGYAEIVGDGIVSTDTERRYNGKLVLYRIVRLGTVPDAPAATIGGTVVSIATDTRQEDGFTLYDYRWAEGKGRISLETDTRDGGALVLSTVRYFDVDDGSAPSGTVIRTDTTKQDGVDLTTKVYALGSGEVSRRIEDALDGRITYTTVRAFGAAVAAPGEFETSEEKGDGFVIYVSRGITIVSADLPDQVDTRNGGALVLTTKRKIDSAPTGSGALIRDDPEPREGYTLYTRTWAVGSGEIDTTSEHQEGNLVITTSTQLTALTGSLPTEPANLLRREVRISDGYRIVTDRYISAGSGQSSYTESTRADGSTEYNVTEFGSAAAVPADPTGSSAHLVAKRQQPQPGGYWSNQATYIKPPATVTLKRQMNFSMPGLASFSGNQLVLSPPISRTILADVEISYSTSQLSDEPYSVSRFSGYYESFTPTETGISVSQQKGLGGYVGSASVSGSSGTFNGVACDTYAATVTASDPTTRPTGLTTLQVDNDIYLVTLAGTVVYRRTKATFTF